MKVRKLQELQEIFNIRLNNAKNKDILIENELKQIDIFLHTEGSNNSRKEILDLLAQYDNLKSNFDRINWLYYSKGDFDTFLRYYEDYLVNGIESPIPVYEFNNEISQEQVDGFFEEIKRIRKQAIELAKYALWLKELTTPNSSKLQKPKNSLTQKEKLLALHYLNIDFGENESNKDRAKLLSLILGLGEENIRKNLSYVSAGKNDVRTQANLKSVSQLFESHGFTDISLTIKKELIELKK